MQVVNLGPLLGMVIMIVTAIKQLINHDQLLCNTSYTCNHTYRL